MLTEYLLEIRKAAGTLSDDLYIVKTLVTTELMRRIADAYNIKTVGDLLVGFKWIGGAMDEHDPAKFVLLRGMKSISQKISGRYQPHA